MLGKKTKKLKRLSNEDFNAIYNLIRDSTQHPETRIKTGQVFGQETWRVPK